MAIEQDVVFKIQLEFDKALKDSNKSLDGLKKKTDQVEDNFEDAEKAAKGFNRQLDTTSKQTTVLQGRFNQLGKVIVAAFAADRLARFISTSVKGFAQLDASLKDLSAITGLAGADLELLRKSANQLALDSTKSADDVLNAFKLIGSAKPELLQDVDALEELTRASITLSEASGLELPVAAETLGSALNALNLPASEAATLINVLAAAAQRGTREIPFVATALSKFGGIASQAGVQIEESVAAVETLGAVIPEAATVGTNLRNVLTILQVEAQKNGREFNSLAEELQNLSPDVDNITKLTKIFGRENLLAIQTLIQNREELGNLQEEITDTNSAFEQQRVRAESAQARLKTFQTAVGVLRNEIGAFIFNAMEPLVRALTVLVRLLINLPQFFRENATAIKLLGVALLGLRLNAIISGVQTLTFGFISFTRAIIASTVASRGLATALNVIRVAIAANPIGLLITAVSTAAAAFLLLRNRIRGATEELFNLGNEVDEVSAKIGEQVFRALINEVSDAELEIEALTEGLDKLGDRLTTLTRGELKSLQLFLENELEVGLRDAANATNELERATVEAQTSKLREFLELINVELEKYTNNVISADEATNNFAVRTLKLLQENVKKAAEAINTANLADDNLIFQLSQQAAKAEKDLQNAIDRIKAFRNVAADLEAPIIEVDPEDIPDVILDINKQFEDGLEPVKLEVDTSDIEDETDDLFEKILSDQASIEEARIALRQQFVDTAFDVTNSLYQRELQALQDARNAGLITEEEFARKQTEIRRKQAIAAKSQAVFEIGINTAVGISKALAQANPVLAGIIGALGALQLATVLAEPIPQFKEGTKFLDDPRAPSGRDKILMYGDKGERIIDRDTNKKYKNDLDLIHDGKVKPGFLSSMANIKPIPKSDWAAPTLPTVDIEQWKSNLKAEILKNHPTNEKQEVKFDKLIGDNQFNTQRLANRLDAIHGAIIEGNKNNNGRNAGL